MAQELHFTYLSGYAGAVPAVSFEYRFLGKILYKTLTSTSTLTII
jgi:hypothetical protein